MAFYRGLWRPQQLSKSMSKLTGFHSIFSKIQFTEQTGFRAFTFATSLRRWRCLKRRTTALVAIQGHLISQLYMDEMLGSVALPFCVKTSDSTRPRITMPEHISLESAKTMLCVLTGQTCLQFQHVYDIFGQRVQRIIMASRIS